MRRSNSHRTALARSVLDPFRPQPDRRFYYAFEAFEQRLAILRRLIRGKDALILVIGERGSGKTTLLQRILDTTDHRWKPCRVQTAASGAVGRLSPRRQAGSPTAFLLQQPAGTIVLMDDAHKLSRRELRKLLRDTLTADPDRKFERVVLFGEPRVGEYLDAVSGGMVAETAVNKIFLPTISEEEAAAFIRHRLAVAGFNGKSPFTPSAVKNLYAGAAGLPGRVNEGAARLWTRKGFSGNLRGGKPRRKAGRLLGTIGGSAAAVAAAILVGVLWMSAGGDRSRDLAASAGQKVVRVKIRSADDQLRPRADVAAASPGAAPRAARRQPARPAESVNPQQQGATARSRPSSSPTASRPSEQPTRELPGRIHREAWLLAQSPAEYTIQLLGVRNERSLLAFVTDHRLDRSGQAAYYRSRFRGGVWYPLVYGVYPSVEDARRAIDTLPETIRNMSPWIRKMSAVHAEIRRAAKP